jgi:hypothetical protein
MSKYRKVNTINLVAGIFLVLFGMVALIYAANPASQIFFVLLFVFTGGYEIGKYMIMRHNEPRKSKLGSF